jgi:hypothetical protein
MDLTAQPGVLMIKLAQKFFLCCLGVVVLLGVMPAQNTYAIKKADKHCVNYDCVYYSLGSVAATCDGSSGSVPTSVNLPKPVVEALNKNKDVYVQAGEKTDTPWQLLAAIHYRETGLSLSYANNNPNGLFQIVSKSYPASPYSKDQFLQQAIDAGNFIHSSSVPGNYANHRSLKKDTLDPDTIKDTLYSYNGRAYDWQAQARGFNPKTQGYEGSPYVMNNFDAKHRNLRQYYIDNNPATRVDPTNGAFIVFAALTGVDGGVCSSSANSGRVIDVARAELAKKIHEDPNGCNCGPGVDDYTDHNPEFWCADFVSWVYKQAGTPFTGGASGGWRIPAAVGIANWMKAHGVWFDNESGSGDPKPGDAIYFSHSHSGATGGANDHIGIIEKVDGDTLTTIEGNSGNAVNRNTYPGYRSNAEIIGWGRMK